jgi:pyruvate/2-oxoglutarate dehydrogenase complex dihydrolipoamide dehydrogenase (E3) component
VGRHHRGEAKANGVKVSKGLFPWAASGRAIANGRDEGFTKLLFDDATHESSAAASSARMPAILISEIALAIEMGADAGRHRPHDSPATNAVRIGWPRGGGVRQGFAPTCRRPQEIANRP